MTRYIGRRSAQAIAVLFGVSVATFLLLQLSGDPTSLMLPLEATPAEHAAMRVRLGLDQPLYTQFVEFVWRALQGDLGESLRGGQPALEMVLERLPATALLAAAAMIVALVIAFPLGIFAAIKPNSWVDRSLMSVALIGQSMPTFWIGLMLIMIFAVTFRAFPTGGMGGLAHLVLPTLTLAFWSAARTARLIRSGMIEALSQDYVRTARAKGVPEAVVVLRHGMRNVMLPVITVVGLDLAVLLGGAVVTETVFSWPGVGRLVIDSIRLRDFPVVQAAVLVIAVIYVVVNLIVDVLYTVVDPRMRLS